MTGARKTTTLPDEVIRLWGRVCFLANFAGRQPSAGLRNRAFNADVGLEEQIVQLTLFVGSTRQFCRLVADTHVHIAPARGANRPAGILVERKVGIGGNLDLVVAYPRQAGLYERQAPAGKYRLVSGDGSHRRDRLVQA